jgi:hypothetical protein
VLQTLPELVRAREPQHMQRDELIAAVTWKMTRAVWRPNMRYIIRNTAEEVSLV